MKRMSFLLMMLFVCLGVGKAEMIANGDFQDPDFTGTNSLGPITSWKTLRGDDQGHRDDKGGNTAIPGPADNQVIRLRDGWETGTLRQFPLGHTWSSSDVFKLTFNASEVNWQSTTAGNEVTAKILQDDFVELWSAVVNLDNTHSGGTYENWAAEQTHEFIVDASTFSGAGVVEGTDLIVELSSTGLVNWVDNVSFEFNDGPSAPIVQQQVGDIGVDVTLNWKAAPDPNEAQTGNQVHPDIVDQYVFMNPGTATDPNLYYIGATGIDPGTSDPNSQYGPIEDLKYESTYTWAVAEAMDGYEQTLTVGVSTLDDVEPNNIVGPIWSFLTLSAAPNVKTPPVDVLAEELDDPIFVCVVQCVTPLDAGDLAWDIDGTSISSGISFIDNGIVDGQFNYTSSLQLSDVAVVDEGVYTCTVSNGSGSDMGSANLAIKRQVAYWPLDSDYDDASPEGLHDADPNGIPSFVPGAYPAQTNSGAEIGENGWAEAGTWNPMELSDQMTIAFWAYWNENDGNWGVLLSKKDASGSENLHWRLSVRPTDGLLSFGSDGSKIWSNNPLPVADWAFIAVTMDGGSGTFYVMPDSSAYLDKIADTITLGSKTDAIFRIGTAGGSTPFNGILDDIQVFNYAMTDEEIAALYNTVSGKGLCNLGSVTILDKAGPSGSNPDCKVDLYDFAVLALEWLECALIPVGVCP